MNDFCPTADCRQVQLLRERNASPPRRPATRWGFLLAAVTYYPLFLWLHSATTGTINYPIAILIIAIMVCYVGMVYGPIGAFLIEAFPARIRYTSFSLPYHIGNGWFGGFLPTTAFAIVAATGDIYAGLRYPVAIAAITLSPRA